MTDKSILQTIRAAFDGDDAPKKNIALRKSHDEISRLYGVLEKRTGAPVSAEELENFRKSFEAWLLDEQWLTATWNDERNCYDEFGAHLAFKAWQAATRSLDRVRASHAADKVRLETEYERLRNELVRMVKVIRNLQTSQGFDPVVTDSVLAEAEALITLLDLRPGESGSDSLPFESVIVWKTIASAPRNEQHILLANDDVSSEGWFDAGYGWCIDQDTRWPYDPPTHWAYLPKLPRRLRKNA